MLAVLREALSNAGRHAGATRTASRSGLPDLTLTVRDDGSGMKASGRRRSGLGNSADRAGELGGTLNVGPAESGGTELEWRVPLSRGDQSGPEPA